MYKPACTYAEGISSRANAHCKPSVPRSRLHFDSTSRPSHGFRLGQHSRFLSAHDALAPTLHGQVFHKAGSAEPPLVATDGKGGLADALRRLLHAVGGSVGTNGRIEEEDALHERIWEMLAISTQKSLVARRARIAVEQPSLPMR